MRFLLASAFPPARLGRQWVDRLISLQLRRIGPLAEPDARALITEPIDGFPDIYPPCGVERILAETRGHPFLIQLVCDHLTRHLNEHRCLRASDEDLTWAFDHAFDETPLFNELWDTRTQGEQELLHRIALGSPPESPPRAPLTALEDEGFLDTDGGGLELALPLFATWIRDRRAEPV